jgi:uncharacterized membrane protein HdeD (DUF308 family)
MDFIASPQVSRQSWWMLGIRGLLAILFGVAALVWPGLTLLALVLLFGVYALVDGIMAVIVSFRERKVFAQWWVVLLEGLAGIVIGILTFIWPGITALVLLYLIAAWAIVTGIFEIVAAFSGRLPGGVEWMLGLAGVLSVLLGMILAALPRAGLLSLVWLIGIYAIVFGILFIIRAFQFRGAEAATA